MKAGKRMGGALLLMMMVLFCGILVCPKKAEAANYIALVKDLKQTGYSQTNAVISWSLYENEYSETKTMGFRIYVGEEYDNMRLVGTTSATTYNVTGLEDGKKYYVTVEAYAQDGQTTDARKYIETLPAAVKNFKWYSRYYFPEALFVQWDEIETADQIEVSLYNSKGKRVEVKTVDWSYTATSFRNLKDEVYTVTARACKTVNGKTYWTPTAKIECFNQARIKSIKAKKKKLTIKWGKVGGATGYDVYVSTKPKSGYKKVKSVGKGKSSVSIAKYRGKAINPKKRYYVYVETKKKSGGKLYKSGRLYYWDSKSYHGYF